MRRYTLLLVDAREGEEIAVEIVIHADGTPEAVKVEAAYGTFAAIWDCGGGPHCTCADCVSEHAAREEAKP